MYNIFLLSVIILTSFPVDPAGGFQNRQERKPGSFNEVKAGQAIEVFLHKADEEKVVIETSNIEPDEVLTTVSDGELKISLSQSRFLKSKVKVDVYYRSLKGITASSASSVFGEDVIRGDDFNISVSSAASVEVNLDVNKLNLDASSAGDTRVSGKAHEVNIDVSSTGSVNAYDLVAEIGDVSASSAGSVRVHITSSLKANASSGGSIRYRGSPQRTNTNSSSGGSVRKAE